MLQPVIQQLSNYFLQPLGLAALLALVPLIIFYLMRPSPEEKVMPSMKFFQEDKKSGRLQKALKILQRNTMLLLHILMILGLAAAISSPYIMAEERPENAVIVIDNSASMKPVFDTIKSESVSELGRSNTVILANDETDVQMKEASPSRARNFIRGLEVEESSTDIVGAVRRAQNYEGKVFVASDFDQTENREQDLSSILQSISASRPLNTFNPQKSNSWGIAGLEITEDNATAIIQNYRDQNSTVRFDVGDDTRQLSLGSGETRKISFTVEDGRNTVSLSQDSFVVDNKAYVIKPSSQVIEVSVISSEENNYLMKSLDLIENINATHLEPSEPLKESDTYIIGEIDDFNSFKVGQITSKVKEGKGLVVYAQRGLEDIGGDFPINSVEDSFNSTVTVSRPVDIQTGNTTLLDSEVEGKSASNPEEALVFSNYGEGEVVYFNFRSQEFRESLNYPVFWKNAIEEISGKSSMQELNRKTGTTILTDRRAIELTETGFRTLRGQQYASNLLNGDESSFETVRTDYDSAETVKSPRDMSTIPIAVVLVLGLLELVYLGRRGEIP